MRTSFPLCLLGAASILVSAQIASAQAYDVEKAGLAKGYFETCAETVEGFAAGDEEAAITACKSAMNDIAGLFSRYPTHTPMDINILSIYSGTTGFLVVATDLQLNENRLSLDGCNHAFHVEKMYDSLTLATNEVVEDQLRKNAQTVKSVLIPWCLEEYGQGN